MARNTALITDAAQADARRTLDDYAAGVAAHIGGDWAGHLQMRLVNSPFGIRLNTPYGQQTVTSASFTIPAVNNTVSVSVISTASLQPGAATFWYIPLTIVSVDSATTLTVRNPSSGNAGTVPSGVGVFAIGYTIHAITPLEFRLLVTDTIGGGARPVPVLCPAIFLQAAVSTSLPVIGLQPQSLTVATGAPYQLTVYAASELPLAYQWKLNGTDILNAIAPTLLIPAAAKPSTGTLSYTVAVSNQNGTVLSNAAVVTVT